MKKLFIGLLVIAAGTAIYFYVANKKQTLTGNSIQQELLVGKWKMESVTTGNDSADVLITGLITAVDSNMRNYNYEFTKEGKIFRSLGDSITKDSSRYEWTKNDQLLWRDDQQDSVGTTLQVFTLNKDSLLVKSSDSTIVFFSKLK